MSEKRFECVFKEHETKNSWSMIKDNQLDKPLYIKDVVDLLNELSDEIEEVGISIKLFEDDVRIKDKKIEEQQALIEEQNKLIEKLRWDLNKTREDLNYFANLKVMAMKGCEPNE